jgi:signal transduction histidine kinase
VCGHRTPQPASPDDGASHGDALASLGVAVAVLAAAVPHGTWVTSVTGNIVYTNPQALRYTGQPGSPWQLMVHPDDIETVRCGSAAGLEPEAYIAECRVERTDRSYRRHSVSFTPTCADDGRLQHWIVIATDIEWEAESRRAEIEAGHALKLESLGRLSAGLAHEINTPIQFVGDNTRFLAEAYQDMLDLLLEYRACMAPATGDVNWDERIRRAHAAELKADIEYLAAEIPQAVSQSLEGTERVASLVRAMKSFSYKDSAEPAYADLNEAIRTTLTVARNEVKYVADVVLQLGELPDVRCHLGDLNQVFLNLLTNAADALADKAERGEIRISSATAGPVAVIRFADDGPGIPEDIQQSIFEPFFTTKGIGKGTGQGLALARAVMEKHGGSIEVRSAIGEGTEFLLRLPIDGKQDASA